MRSKISKHVNCGRLSFDIDQCKLLMFNESFSFNYVVLFRIKVIINIINLR